MTNIPLDISTAKGDGSTQNKPNNESSTGGSKGFDGIESVAKK